MTKTPTVEQSAALLQAANRQLGEPWKGDRQAAEECCDLGWLHVEHLSPDTAGTPEGSVYLLTDAGSAIHRGRLGNEDR